MTPIKNIKANKIPSVPIPINVNALWGVFWKRLINNNICPIIGSNTKGCKTDFGSVIDFVSISASAWNKKRWLLPAHSKYPSSDVKINRPFKTFVFMYHWFWYQRYMICGILFLINVTITFVNYGLLICSIAFSINSSLPFFIPLIVGFISMFGTIPILWVSCPSG